MNHFGLLRQVLALGWSLVSRRPQSLHGLKRRWEELEHRVVSWSALLSRQLGTRALLIIGFGASAYALALFAADRIAPSSTSAAHDAILKARWASPAPSRKIVIVDIDERSLAALAPEHGRWPWPRAVLADGLQRISDAGARAVAFNVMLSDADKGNPDSDAAMEASAAMLPRVVYPAIRLSPENDKLSQLKVRSLLETTGDPDRGGDRPVAMLLPMFAPMLPRLGIANQMPDADGVVRRYPVIWSDAVITMPSLVARTATLAGHSVSETPATITLNWRNKRGRYDRISFSDLLQSSDGDEIHLRLRDAIVVLGVSAPGLGMTKATAVTAVEDDNEILATALDDVINDTHLRVMPAWILLFVELGAVWILVWVGLGRKLSPVLNAAFVVLQSGAASITLLSASYTSYLVDLTTPMAFGAGVFAAVKLVQSLDSGWSRARPGYRYAAPVAGPGVVLSLGYRDSRVSKSEADVLQRFLEAQAGFSSVIRVDDLFGGENFARRVCEDCSCQVVRITREHLSGFFSALEALPFRDKLDVREVPLRVNWNPEQDEFRAALAPSLLRQCADLIDRTTVSPCAA